MLTPLALNEIGSRECQQQDWKPDHQVECRQLEQIVSLRLRSPQIADMLLLGRVMRRLGAGESEKSAGMELSPTELVWYEGDFCQETMLLATLAQKLKLIDGTTLPRTTYCICHRRSFVVACVFLVCA